MSEPEVNWEKQERLHATLHSFFNVALKWDEENAPVGNYSERHRVASIIFVKMIAHAFMLLNLAPARDRVIWDLGSACTIARSLIEAGDALGYFALAEIPDEERHFRQRLALLHDQERRAKMLETIGSQHEEFAKIKSTLPRLRKEILSHSFSSTLGKDFKNKITGGDAPLFHLSQRARNLQLGLDHKQHQVATMFLSQYVHTTPMAIAQLEQFRAGSQDSLGLMLAALQHSLPYFAVAIEGIMHLYGKTLSEVAPDSHDDFEFWIQVARGKAGRGRFIHEPAI